MTEKIHNIPGIGMRIIKSGTAVLLCFFIERLRGSGGMVFYSQLAALWCMRDYVSETWHFAKQRTIGTAIGALYGLLLLVLYHDLYLKILPGGDMIYSIMVSFFVVLILYTTVLVKQKGASYFSCVVFLSIVINHIQDINPYVFVWNRFLDTMIGILTGALVNCFAVPRKKHKEILFLSGLDDTLLTKDGSMSDYSRVELNRMIRSGAKFTVSTVRTPASLMEVLRGIDLNIPVIAMDGAALYHVRENRYEFVYTISEKHCAAVENFLDGKKIPYFANVVIEDRLLIFYQDTDQAAYKEIIEKLRRSPYRNYIKRPVPKKEKVVYFMMIDRTARIDELYEEMEQKECFRELKMVKHPSTECEGCSLLKVYHRDASKNNMLEYLKGQLKIERTVTFGTIEGKYTYFINPGDFNKVVKLMKREYEGENVMASAVRDLFHLYRHG